MRTVLRAAALTIALSLVGAIAPGCAVSETDVHRWENTERGPEKLVAVVTHDKYSLPLRIEAALSLVRMKARGGRRIGGDLLTNSLAQLPDEQRRKIVSGMAPELLKNITAPRPPRNPDGSWPADPSIPYKDAAFALMSHEPSLVGDEDTKRQLNAALGQWAQTDFENRIENPGQQYGIEQMMRYFGSPSVRALPSLISEETARIDRIAGLIADLGDPETRQRGSEQLVILARRVETPEWEKKTRALVEEANRKQKFDAKDDQIRRQITGYQDAELQKVFVGMKKLGGRPAVEYALAYAADKNKPEERRKQALAAIEGRVDKANTADLDKLFAIASAEDTPDALRDLAFARLGELPKNVIAPKLYPLFERPKWKIRWVAASLLLKTLSTRDVAEFMRHLPASAATKMGMSEPLTYGSMIAKIEAGPGDPKAREVITPYLTQAALGPKLTAIGFYYGGKKADQAALRPYEEDKGVLPKCDEADECGWSCGVPKAGGAKGETDNKPITTVGEFVKFCVVPSMEGS